MIVRWGSVRYRHTPRYLTGTEAFTATVGLGLGSPASTVVRRGTYARGRGRKRGRLTTAALLVLGLLLYS